MKNRSLYLLGFLAVGWMGSLQLALAEDSNTPAPGAVSIETERQEIKIAEPVQVTIRVRNPGNAGYSLPRPLDLAPFIELRRSEQFETINGEKIQVFRLTVVTYEDTGDLTLPTFKLKPKPPESQTAAKSNEEPKPAPVELEVPAAKIRVKSVLGGVEKPEPRDIAGPLSIQVKDYRLLVFMALGFMWILAAWVLRIVRGRQTQTQRIVELPPERPPHEIALEKLNQIVQDDLLRKGKFRDYFIRVSDTVREYLGNRYQFFALDLTTRELLEELRDRPTLGLDLGKLVTLLRGADLVKFAKVVPSDELSSQTINEAFSLVETTKQTPAEPKGLEVS